MLEIAICEDEQADRERLQGMLYAILDKYNMEQQITCYSSGEELLGSGVQFQLIFMDIVMEGRRSTIETIRRRSFTRPTSGTIARRRLTLSMPLPI